MGTFGSPIGLKGEIKVKMLTSSFEFFKILKVYLNEDASEKWNFIKMRILNNKLIVQLQDCNNRDDAEKFRGKKIRFEFVFVRFVLLYMHFVRFGCSQVEKKLKNLCPP